MATAQFFKDESVKKSTLATFFFACVVTLTAIIFYFVAQPVLPLLYSKTTAPEQLVPKVYLAFFPILSWSIALIHTLLIHTDNTNDPVIKKLFSWAGLSTNILLLSALVRIILITT